MRTHFLSRALSPLASAVLLSACVFGVAACESSTTTATAAAASGPRAVVGPPQTPATAEANARTYTFDQNSSKIGFVGKKVTGSHTGGFNTFSGTVAVGPGGVDKGVVNLSIDMGSVFSDSERLTGHLRSPDFFDADKFKTTTFVSTGVGAGEGGAKTLTGNLDLHGVSKSVAFPATIAVTDDVLTLKATFLLNRKDFAINYPGKANDLISDDVELTFDIKAAGAAPAAAVVDGAAATPPADGATPPAGDATPPAGDAATK
jgi:polyisoprenoid-binding protein YceI